MQEQKNVNSHAKAAEGNLVYIGADMCRWVNGLMGACNNDLLFYFHSKIKKNKVAC